MVNKAVFSLARDEAHAEKIVHALQAAGFSYDHISVLFADQKASTARSTPKGSVTSSTRGAETLGTIRSEETDVAFSRNVETSTKRGGAVGHEKHTKAPEGATTGAVAGGLIGGSLGLLAGIGSLAIPGVGPFIAAGAIMSALAGSALGGATGLIIGSLIGLGIPEIEAKRYHDSIIEGSVLISVHTNSNEEVARATEVMRTQGAKDICSTAESSSRSMR